jgi:hypothetical protein
MYLKDITHTLQINVDYTTHTDDFLILMARVNFCGCIVLLYFSMRAYPKRKGQHDQKKLEASFIRSSRHLLSKKYAYTIVSGRGFGNDRFAQLGLDNRFDYVLRPRKSGRSSARGIVQKKMVAQGIALRLFCFYTRVGHTKKISQVLFAWNFRRDLRRA